MLAYVTLTGADDSTDHQHLVELQKKFPFVEWGILISKNNTGQPRYPSRDWLTKLLDVKGLNLSLHVCGSLVRDFCIGKATVTEWMGINLWDKFKRVQLNFHAMDHAFTHELFELIGMYPDKEFIFQYDEVNYEIIKAAIDSKLNVSTLFDKSGGAGILPEAWHGHLDKIRCGYAGGLSPENVSDQIPMILSASGNHDTWIDAETHVRSSQDTIFDLQKVETFLIKSQPYVRG